MALRTLLSGTIASAAVIAPQDRSHAQASIAELPPDVLTFVHRRARCHEWSVESMKPGATEAETNWRTGKCADLADEEKALREKFAGDPAILKGLDAQWSIIVRRIPVQIAPEALPAAPGR